MMIDLDGNGRYENSLRNVLHWLVVNIPGNEISKGEAKAELLKFLIQFSL